MKIEEWTKRLKECKASTYYANIPDLKVKYSRDKTFCEISLSEVCRLCKHDNSKTVFVQFFKPHQLTIFEAGLLYMVFAQNKRPADYANYHNCISGKEFVENIDYCGARA